ncbi:DUF488 domain-containing protein [Acinetobacter gerneri]|uniref:DUF488 domain-containing protein n=1 Tax=Acinetobacter gerneri TaxID=202952 RepID=UPI002935B6C9|nr:DUF488 domain-containing protein [Acinetobacter gerneri]MDV2438801.1 DUF488 domain-containing protein [Acinetobacter gerneri]
MTITIKRIYSEALDSDGKRILVDRLWPRGIKKEVAKIDLWAKEITPSNELRKWYHEDMPARWEEFQVRYQAELAQHPDQLQQLKALAKQEHITLLTAAKNEQQNHATVLKSILES